MATSGSVDFSVSRDNLIEDALRVSGILGIEDSASSNQKTWAARQLNMLIKNWQGFGPALWARKTGWILPQTDTNEIGLGPSGDHASLSYTQTTLSAAASGTSLTVTSITGISDGDYIGVELSDGTVQWTTVNGTPTGSTVDLDDALTSAASDGGYVWAYTTKLQRPLKIIEAYLRDEVSNTEVEMDVVAKQEFEAMSAKESEGDPNLLSYDPQLATGKAFIYPRMGDGRSAIKIVFHRPFEDFDADVDTPDFPQEWYLPIMLNLAVLLAPAGGLPVADRRELKQEAGQALLIAQAMEPEEGSLMLRPDDQGS